MTSADVQARLDLTTVDRNIYITPRQRGLVLLCGFHPRAGAKFVFPQRHPLFDLNILRIILGVAGCINNKETKTQRSERVAIYKSVCKEDEMNPGFFSRVEISLNREPSDLERAWTPSDSLGFLPIHAVISSQKSTSVILQEIEMLLKIDMRLLNSTTPFFRTPFHAACSYRRREVAIMLYNRGGRIYPFHDASWVSWTLEWATKTLLRHDTETEDWDWENNA